ncbi:MAG: tRNA (adenosine(37)-N6)-threonylcarbamoyltransferase complex transferase subunit TsaD [Rhodospirillaceae bacterium]|nr:MAG: tRNA (adenosine(37)-N6)-threonylcarbamoyltransferase complex transferase subunit TsaD [Rhodospirillaceae bacterium]
MRILGLESSCDETAAAIVNDKRQILAESLHSQIADHQPYGGIVPEIAARAHLDYMDSLVADVMAKAGLDFCNLDGIAATGGPGLVGGLLVGVMTAKAIAAVHDLPFLAINHLEGHALSLRLTEAVDFPYLLLLVSGGHSQFVIVEGVGRYVQLGTTIDDAVGEAFDKTAKLLGLPYPGGPQIEKAAKEGDAKRFALPRPMAGREGCDLSLSGLKTAVRRTVSRLGADAKKTETINDIAAAFQAAIGDVLADRTQNAIRLFQTRHPGGNAFVIAGGVAANAYLRTRLCETTAAMGVKLHVPPPQLCTDNGVMIAWAGIERLQLGWTDRFDFTPKPRWPLDPDAATRHGRQTRP